MDLLVIRFGHSPSIFVGTAEMYSASLPRRTPLFRSTRGLRRRSHSIGSASKISLNGSEVAPEDIWKFLEDRKFNGDFISRVSDALWRRDLPDFNELDQVSSDEDSPSIKDQVSNNEDSLNIKAVEDEDYQGYLKIAKTKEWISGVGLAPMNRKQSAQDRLQASKRTKELNILRYEALKRELLLLTAGIGASCTGYCLLTLSVQAAVSYAIGVVFSCLYLRLLCYHSDNLSKKDVPSVFFQKSSKKIGVRSEDLKNLIERTVWGSSIALSSPRLVLPAALYGLWALSHQYSSDFFDFQIVPAMMGLFAYKAAALVQVYRDNEGLRLILPENDYLSNE